MYGNAYGTGYNVGQYPQYNPNRPYQVEQYAYPNSYQQTQQTMQVQQSLKGRPVSSYDEAKASMIDLDGSLFVFTDVANNKIYTKQIMLDGSAELKTYTLEQQKQNKTVNAAESEIYVMRDEFEEVIETLSSKIKQIAEVSENEYESDVKTNVRKQSGSSKRNTKSIISEGTTDG